MLFLVSCSDIQPFVNLIRDGLIPIVQIVIPIILIILGIFDLAKAVIASKEDEIKAAQKMLIKRAIYAIAIFFVVLAVKLVFGLLGSTGNATIEAQGNSWVECWNNK